MQTLSASQVLTLWERGAVQTLPQRALDLVAAVSGDLGKEALAALSIGRRNTRLLALRESLFGQRLVSVAHCPACGERLELNLRTDELRVPSAAASDTDQALSVQLAGYQVAFRLPTSQDLLDIVGLQDGKEAQRELLQRCLLDIVYDRNQEQPAPNPSDELPDVVVDEVMEQMDRADPGANVELALTCPVCGHEWLALFDIVSFLWSEIETWAHGILEEIHALAAVYGWSERDILAMSPTRRQLYVKMISG